MRIIVCTLRSAVGERARRRGSRQPQRLHHPHLKKSRISDFGAILQLPVRLFTTHPNVVHLAVQAECAIPRPIRRRLVKLIKPGQMRWDFTYVDDAVEAVVRPVPRRPAPNPAWTEYANWRAIRSAVDGFKATTFVECSRRRIVSSSLATVLIGARSHHLLVFHPCVRLQERRIECSPATQLHHGSLDFYGRRRR
jgi:hypothetical protein